MNDFIKIYYTKYFPFELIYSWIIKYGEFNQREFSIIKLNNSIQRGLKFNSIEDFKHYIIEKDVVRIDIGPYNDGKNNPFEKELIFDVDMSDYDINHRICCSNDKICEKCWNYILVGIHILKFILEKNFAFKKIMFVNSGRRGFHCWVFDKEVIKLTNETRKCIIEFLKNYQNLSYKFQSIHLLKNHETGIYEFLQTLEPYYLKILEILPLEFLIKVIKEIMNPLLFKKIEQNLNELKENLKKEITSDDSSSSSNFFLSKKLWFNYISLIKNQLNNELVQFYILAIQFYICFPLLDTNVTQTVNHLLKLPFSLHNKNFGVSLPIDLTKYDKFEHHHSPLHEEIVKNIDLLSFNNSKIYFQNFITSL
jgi:DNA primase small subunit